MRCESKSCKSIELVISEVGHLRSAFEKKYIWLHMIHMIITKKCIWLFSQKSIVITLYISHITLFSSRANLMSLEVCMSNRHFRERSKDCGIFLSAFNHNDPLFMWQNPRIAVFFVGWKWRRATLLQWRILVVDSRLGMGEIVHWPGWWVDTPNIFAGSKLRINEP